MISTSSLVFDFLKERAIGFTFSTEQLYELLKDENPHITLGGIGGFCSRAHAAGHLSAVRNGKGYYYSVIDMAGCKVRTTTTPGGVEGRRSKGRGNSLGQVTVKSVQDRLLELAAELEMARTPLADYSTDDLLSELMRRQRQANKGG